MKSCHKSDKLLYKVDKCKMMIQNAMLRKEIKDLIKAKIDALELEQNRLQTIDVCVVDTDTQSYASRTVDAVLCSAEQEKKRKYSAAVEDRRASFTPFVVSVDGVLGHDAQHLMKRLCDQIAVKWEKSHSEVMGWVRARMAFAILCATNLCLRGSRVKWRCGHSMDDGAGLPHFPH